MSTAPQNPLSPSGPEAGKNRRAGKAVLAGVVAVGLLAAGGGTFAKWSEEHAIASDDIVRAGELSMTAPKVSWTDGQGKLIDVRSYRIVPGDTIQLHASTTITAVGDTLNGSLELKLPAALEAEIKQLDEAGYVDYDVTLSRSDETKSADDSYPITDADDGTTVEAVAQFTWDAQKTTGSAGERVTQAMAGTRLVLAQQ
jgi:alternate signal-mediated exported protein